MAETYEQKRARLKKEQVTKLAKQKVLEPEELPPARVHLPTTGGEKPPPKQKGISKQEFQAFQEQLTGRIDSLSNMLQNLSQVPESSELSKKLEALSAQVASGVATQEISEKLALLSQQIKDLQSEKPLLIEDLFAGELKAIREQMGGLNLASIENALKQQASTIKQSQALLEKSQSLLENAQSTLSNIGKEGKLITDREIIRRYIFDWFISNYYFTMKRAGQGHWMPRKYDDLQSEILRTYNKGIDFDAIEETFADLEAEGLLSRVALENQRQRLLPTPKALKELEFADLIPTLPKLLPSRDKRELTELREKNIKQRAELKVLKRKTNVSKKKG